MMPPDPMPVQEPLLLIRRRPPALALPDDPSHGKKANQVKHEPGGTGAVLDALAPG